MFLDLNELYEDDIESLDVEGEIQLNSLDMEGRDIKFISPITYKGSIYKVDRDRIIHLNISFNHKEDCGRCLETFESNNEVILTGKLVNESFNQEEDENLIFYEDGKLNLAKEITETIILNLPMKPLCHEECKGLCSECGINLNEGECSCETQYVDPRFEKLKNLFPEE